MEPSPIPHVLTTLRRLWEHSQGKRVFEQVIGQMFPNSDEFELLGEESLKSNFNYCQHARNQNVDVQELTQWGREGDGRGGFYVKASQEMQSSK